MHKVNEEKRGSWDRRRMHCEREWTLVSGSECRWVGEEVIGKIRAGDEGSAKDRLLPAATQGRTMCLPSQEPPCSWTLICPCPPQGRVISRVVLTYNHHSTALGTTKIHRSIQWQVEVFQFVSSQGCNISKVLPVNVLSAFGKCIVFLLKRGITDDWSWSISTKTLNIPSHLVYSGASTFWSRVYWPSTTTALTLSTQDHCHIWVYRWNARNNKFDLLSSFSL